MWIERWRWIIANVIITCTAAKNDTSIILYGVCTLLFYASSFNIRFFFLNHLYTHACVFICAIDVHLYRDTHTCIFNTESWAGGDTFSLCNHHLRASAHSTAGYNTCGSKRRLIICRDILLCQCGAIIGLYMNFFSKPAVEDQLQWYVRCNSRGERRIQ